MGAGAWSETQLNGWSAVKNASIVALCDRHPERRSPVAEYLFTGRKILKTTAGRLKIYAGFLIIALGIATAVMQLKPPADSGYAVDWVTKYDSVRAKDTFSIVEQAFVPIPELSLHFWNTNFLDIPPKLAIMKHILSGLILLWAAIFLFEKWRV